MTCPRANLSLWKPSIPCPSVSFYVGMEGYFLPLQSDVVKLSSQNCFSVALWGFLSNTVGYFPWEKSSHFQRRVPKHIAPPSSPWVCLCLLIVSSPLGWERWSGIFRVLTGPGGLVLCGLLKLWESLFPFLLGRVWIFVYFVH